jgi:lysozyme family protein
MVTSNGSYGTYNPADVYGAGFGRTFVQGTDFQCNAAICFAIGPDRHQQFQQLQTLLNLFTTPVGFAPLDVDGFIGAQTVNAAIATAKAVRAAGLPGFDAPAMVQISSGVTKEQLASLVDDFNLALAAAGPVMATQRAQQGLPPSPVIAPSTPIPTTPATQAIVEAALVAATVAATAALPKSKKAWIWWVAGGAVTVLAVGRIGYVVYRRKAQRKF